MTHYRYVKQTFGCHCFYNDSSFKRYNRAHLGGDTLIFNFGSSCGCNSYMPYGVGGWFGGMTNWFGGLWGGMCNMFGGKGFWGGLGAGLGMGLMSFVFGGGLNYLLGGIGNFSKKSPATDANDKIKSDKTDGTEKQKSEIEKKTEAEQKAEVKQKPNTETAIQDEQTPSDVMKSIGDIATLDDTALKNARTKLKELLGDPELSADDKDKAVALLKQVEDKLKQNGKLPLEDNEVKIGDEVLKINDLTPEDIANLTAEDINSIRNTYKFKAILGKLGVEQINDDKYGEMLSLPKTIDVDTVKALAIFSKNAKMPTAMGYNDHKSLRDHYMAGYIDPETVKLNADSKLTYEIDCEELFLDEKAAFGNKYTVTQQESDDYNLKLSEGGLKNGRVNPEFENTGVNYNLKSGDTLMRRTGKPYILKLNK